MDKHTIANLEWFFAALEPIEAVYDDPEFSFLVHSGSDGVALVNSRLALQPLPSDHPDRVIVAGNFYGFTGHLKPLGVNPRELIKMLLDGYVPAPDRVWKLSRDSEFRATPTLYRQHPRSPEIDPQQQIYELFGHGLSVVRRQSEEDDWLLRGGATPYSGISDLLRDLRLPFGHHQFHMIALPPLVVDVTSRVRGEIAELKLRRSKHLPVEKISLGIVVRDKDAVAERTRIAGDRFQWETSEQSEDVLVGKIGVRVPKASVVHCLAVFDHHCLHHYWVGDPDASQNPLRTIYEVFDPNFEDAISMLTQSASKGQSSAQENAVAVLLWVLGFAPLHLGRFSEAPDVIAVSHDGHFIVVECTLSDLQTKKQNKPQKLLDRTNEIRAALERSNVGGKVCIPVLVTSRKRADIEDDVADCERKGIVVYTQDDIEPLILSTIISPQSDVRFRDLKQRLDEVVERFNSKEQKEREMARNVEEMKKSFDAISRLKDDLG